jgi:eukaryotic-like serine/threonine-protein kinase
MIGQTVGQYRVESLLGTGGMGVVYEAVDTSLQRQVAIKVLRDDLKIDSDLAARFIREARLLASLNHPNIASIYGLEESNGSRMLVLEFVPGQTLAERLSSGRIPVREVLSIARQIADALEAAHERNIIHRDLKPGNIKLTDDDRVKVLDFGLAKAVAEASLESSSESETEAMATRRGMVLGTPAYMSPEQACGKAVDARTDIWAFGCVLYEMLAAKRPFGGDSIQELVASILERQPDYGSLPPTTHPAVRRLLRRCLEKDPRQRLRHIGDARMELEDVLAGNVENAVVARPRRGFLAAGLIALLLVAGSFGVARWTVTTPSPGDRQVVKFSIDLPKGQVIRASWNPSLEISPDGRTLYYMVPKEGGGWQPQIRSLDDLEPRTSASITGGVPLFSPDSQTVCFIDERSRTIRRAALSGGAPLTIAPFESMTRGFWGRDNYLYWTPAQRSGIARTPVDGGETTPVTELDESRNEQKHSHAQPLPGGKQIMYVVTDTTMTSYDDARIVMQSLETGTRKTLIEGGWSPRHVTTGHILYARDGDLYAVPFDTKKKEVSGPPRKVVEGVLMSRNTGAAYFSLSETGTLAYVPGGAVDGERELVWVDREGREAPLPLPPASYLYPRLSADGRKMALEIEGPTHDIYVYDFERGVLTRLSLDGLSHAPVWSPDGEQIGFRSWKLGGMTLWSMPADRSRPEERLLDEPGMQSLVSWSPDGRYVSYVDRTQETGMDVLVLPLYGERKPQPVAQSKFVEGSPKFSPDGKWLAYCSNESGRPEVFVQPYPGPGPKIQISTDGGTDPVWRPKGGELYYRDGAKMMAVEVRTQPTIVAGRPAMLWEGDYSHGMSSSCGAPGVSSFNYDVTPDGDRFLMVKDVHHKVESTRIVVILNWTTELQRLMTARH